MVLESHGNRFWWTASKRLRIKSAGSSFRARRTLSHVCDATTAKRPEINFCVLKPDELVGVVNTLFINHLLEDSTEPSDKSVGKAYTPVDNGVYRQYQRVVSQAVDFGESWQEFCFYVLHLGQ